MSMIPDEIIEQIRDGADIVGLIGETVELKRTGADYRGPCPFHGGTHRNFAVIPKKARYYCFVCKESGDAFSYFMKRFGMDYPTAVREVARRTGITIPETTRQGPDPREPLYQALAVAQDWFTRQLRELPEAAAAREYLGGRGLDLDAVAPFDLGYAPRGPAFLAAMTQLGLSEAVLLEAGLLARKDDGAIVAKFRGRLLFPIHDLRGRVVGFGGRLLGPGEPKYLNSPETKVFHKGGLLYNLHQAKQAIRKEEIVILVEGYFDVLRLLLAGVENVVAPLGTALTPEQAALLRRYAPAAILLLDSDSAGLKASFRAADELLRHEMRVRVATLPPGSDPDSLVQSGGAAALEPILRAAVDVLERKLQILDLKGWFGDMEHRREALDRLLPTIRAAKDPITRELYLSLVAERAGVNKQVLADEVAALPDHSGPAAGGPPPARAGAPGVHGRAQPPLRRDGARAEQQLLKILVASEDWLARARTEVPAEWFELPEHREIYTALREKGLDRIAIAESLTEGARPHWLRLMEAAPEEMDSQQLDRAYEGACRALEARPHFRDVEALSERIRRAAPEEQAALTDEKERRVREVRTRYPDEWEKRYGWRRFRTPKPEGRPS